VSAGGQAAHRENVKKDDGIACKRKTQSDRIKRGTSSVRLGMLARDFAFFCTQKSLVLGTLLSSFLTGDSLVRKCRVSWKARDTLNVRLGLARPGFVRQAPPGGMP
jgi:hypothetical protein